MLTKYHLQALAAVLRYGGRIKFAKWMAAGVIALFVTSGVDLIRAAEPASGQPLAGFVTAPRKLPGVGRWQLAHKVPYGRLVALAWNGDGSQIAFNDHSYVRLCDAQTLETKTFLVGHARDVTSIDWNHRTNRLASASCDGTVRIWSGAGVPEKVLQTDAGEVKSVAWTNDGALLAASTSRGSVWIWNADGSLKATLKGKVPINAVAWSADKTKLVAGDDDGHLKLWNPEGKLLGDSSAHLARVTAVAWSPDGKHFASMTYGEKDPTSERYHSELRIWKEDGSLATAIPGQVPFGSFCFSPDGQEIALYDCDGTLNPFDLQGNRVGNRASLRRYVIDLPKGVAWAPQGQLIALGGMGQLSVVDSGSRAQRTSPSRSFTLSARPRPLSVTTRDGQKWLVRLSNGEPYRVWTTTGQSAPASLPNSTDRSISQPMWNPAGDQLAFVEPAHRLRVWPVGSPSIRLVLESKEPIARSAWTPDGTALAALDEAGNLQVVRTDGKPLLTRKVAPPMPDSQPDSGETDSISRILFRADGRAIAVSEQTAIQVIPLDGSPVKTLAYEKSNTGGEGNAVWWSHDGKRMTSMRKQDKEHVQVVTWDLVTGNRTMLTDFSDEFGAVDCSSDGKRLLIGFDLGFWQVRRLDDPSATPLESEPAAHISTVRSVVFSDDGRRFATGGWDGLVKIWSSEGALQQTLDGNDWPVHGLTWTADGQHLISLGRDRTTLLWSLKTGRPVVRLEADAAGNVTLITQDGRIFGPSRQQIDYDFWALIEKPTGEMQTVGYAEFLNRTAGR